MNALPVSQPDLANVMKITVDVQPTGHGGGAAGSALGAWALGLGAGWGLWGPWDTN